MWSYLRVALISVTGLFAVCAQAQNPQAVRFTVDAIDRSADPCVDFHQYACGNWFAQNPMPAQVSVWGRTYAVRESTLETLRHILDDSSSTEDTRDPVAKLIGDYYASCMDQPAINAKGIEPVKPEIDHIHSIRRRSDIAGELARLHQIGVEAAFGFYSDKDVNDSRTIIAWAFAPVDGVITPAARLAGAFGLPDRDYYINKDSKTTAIRNQYAQYLRKIWTLLGESDESAAVKAQTVITFETALAKAMPERALLRDTEEVVHRMTKQKLVKLMPSLDWTRYFAGIKAGGFKQVEVVTPESLRGVDKLLRERSLDAWKAYLEWRYIDASISMLPAPFLQEQLAFGKVVSGAQQARPRWEQCIAFTDRQLGEALGQKYVEKTFNALDKERVLHIVQRIESEMEKDIRDRSWMSPQTKEKALAKLHSLVAKIAYPDRWRSYTGLKVVRGDALGNWHRAANFEFQSAIAEIGKTADRTTWSMTPQTVNAYYDPQTNSINFPAARLQPPWYDPAADDAINYGGIAAVIGHELTHGFDDDGRRFDAQGNLKNWWTAEDDKHFESKAACFESQYSGYTVAGGLSLNGKLTLGENIADAGGLHLAYASLMGALASKDVSKVDGYSPQQRFFLSYAQHRCDVMTDEEALRRVRIDPHSPGKYRVNGVVSNMSEFREAFQCKEGQPMVRENACRIW